MLRFEYLLSGLVACALTVLLDRLLGTRVLGTRRFGIYLAVMLVAQFIFETYGTSRPVFLYDDCCIIGIRLIATPLEDFFFGIALAGMAVVLWEWAGTRDSRES